MELHQAKRSKAYMRISLQGHSGVGKTYSALLLAFGLTGDWKKIAVIDTENQSADLYSELGNYYVLSLSPPYSPEKYAEAILLCEASGIECAIIDSISHEWSGKGGCLQLHEEATAAMRVPNSFQAWATITPRHQAFIDSILKCKCHVISTIRAKSDYVMTERNGKQVPTKVGLAPVTRDGFDFEMTVALDIDAEHYAFTSKDRTGLFSGKPKFQITADTGKAILQWCNEGEDLKETIKVLIKQCVTVDDLNILYHKYPAWKKELYDDFSNRKLQIQGMNQFITNSANIGGNHHGNAIATS